MNGVSVAFAGKAVSAGPVLMAISTNNVGRDKEWLNGWI